MVDELPNPATFQQLIDAGILEIGDGYRAKNSELGDGGPIFLRAGHVSDSAIDFNGVEHFKAECVERVQSKLSRPGDTIITTKGNSTGRTSYVRPEMPAFVYSPHLSYWRSLDHKKIVPRFLRYWSRAPEFVNQLQGMMVSTDMAPYLSLTDQRRLSISLLAPCDQSRVGDILGSLDDKMELNQNLNRVLVGMAQAIFKAWFVDFEPVKAKATGATNFPAMPQPIFDHLPSTFVDSELGEIPHGWHLTPIGELVEVVGGGTPSTKNSDFWKRGIHPFCTPKDMSTLHSPILLNTERHITDAGVNKVSSGQLPAGTVLLSSRAPIGYLAIAWTAVSVNQGIIAMMTGEIPNTYILLWTEANMDVIKSRSGGSTFAEISKKNFRPILALRPDDDTLVAFQDIVDPMFNLIAANEQESVVLQKTRDTLLPRLVSGEVAAPPIRGDDNV